MSSNPLTTDGLFRPRMAAMDLDRVARAVRNKMRADVAPDDPAAAVDVGSLHFSVGLHQVFDPRHDHLVWRDPFRAYTVLLAKRRSRLLSRNQSVSFDAPALLGFPFDATGASVLSTALGLAEAGRLRGGAFRVAAVLEREQLEDTAAQRALQRIVANRLPVVVIVIDYDFSLSDTARSARASTAVVQESQHALAVGHSRRLGPVSAYDLSALVENLRDAREHDGPSVVHVQMIDARTAKASKRTDAPTTRLGGVDRSGLDGFRSPVSAADQRFARMLVALAEHDSNVVVLQATDDGACLRPFAERFRNRFFDCRRNLGQMTALASGLSAGGCRPIVFADSRTFVSTCDSIIDAVAAQRIGMCLILRPDTPSRSRATIPPVAASLARLRLSTNFVVAVPRDAAELEGMVRWAAIAPIPTGILWPNSRSVATAKSTPRSQIRVGTGDLLRDGTDAAIVALGPVVNVALKAASQLDDRHISTAVIDLRFLKPLDVEIISRVARRVQHLFVIESAPDTEGLTHAIGDVLALERADSSVVPLHLAAGQLSLNRQRGGRDLQDEIVRTIVHRVSPAVRQSADHLTPTSLGANLRVPGGAGTRYNEQTLSKELLEWVEAYERVGYRDRFLWHWCVEAATLTTLPCVAPEHVTYTVTTKVLETMWVVMLDDALDRLQDPDLFEALIEVCRGGGRESIKEISRSDRAYAEFTARLRLTLDARPWLCPRYREFRKILHYDLQQLINGLRYTGMVGQDLDLLNLAEHDLYLPHCMHMMYYGTFDLMCSPRFDRSELGRVRQLLWHASAVGRIGNVLSTWERELEHGDFTNGVFAWAIENRLIGSRDLENADRSALRGRIGQSEYHKFFRTHLAQHRRRIRSLVNQIESFDAGNFMKSIDAMFELHLACRGHI